MHYNSNSRIAIISTAKTFTTLNVFKKLKYYKFQIYNLPGTAFTLTEQTNTPRLKIASRSDIGLNEASGLRWDYVLA